MSIPEMYFNGDYLKHTGGTWHIEHSSFKAHQVLAMLSRHPEVEIDSVCEIGCGAGGILAELQRRMPKGVAFTGYDISPLAHDLSRTLENERITFVLGEAFADQRTFDLALGLDVVEHVEDCFEFLRQTRHKARWKIYHIPLDAHANWIIRGKNHWDAVGHIHLFSAETALRSLEYSGHKVVDWMFTDAALNCPAGVTNRLANLLIRRPIGALSKMTASRLVGGYSLLVLAK